MVAKVLLRGLIYKSDIVCVVTSHLTVIDCFSDCVFSVFQATALSVMEISDHHMTDVGIIRPDAHIEVHVKSQRYFISE